MTLMARGDHKLQWILVLHLLTRTKYIYPDFFGILELLIIVFWRSKGHHMTQRSSMSIYLDD